MACEDCTFARECPEHRRYDPKCLYCGARYLQSLKTWPPPREIDGRTETTAQRQEWRAHVLKTWAEFGHDPQEIRALAAEGKVPFEPVGGRHAESTERAGDEAPAPKVRQQKDRRGRTHVRQPA